MLALGTLLGRVRPTVTTVVSVFDATLATEITLVIIANTTGSAATFSLYHVLPGDSATTSNALYYNVSLAANQTFTFAAQSPGAGIQVLGGESIQVDAGTISALTFSVYGVTENVADRVRN